MSELSPTTLSLLRNILVSQQLSVGAEDFLVTATAAATALTELDQALSDADTEVERPNK